MLGGSVGASSTTCISPTDTEGRFEGASVATGTYLGGKLAISVTISRASSSPVIQAPYVVPYQTVSVLSPANLILPIFLRNACESSL